jgi:hypothetical protein
MSNKVYSVITWVPSVLEKAKKTGMALLNDNSLIDLSLNEIPKGKNILEPISEEEIKKFDNYKLDQLEKFIIFLFIGFNS